MAKKTGGKDFKPGVSGNPDGRPPVPEDIKEARALNKVELERILNKLIYMDPQALIALLSDTNVPVLEHMIGRIISKAIKDGDFRRLDFLLDRLGLTVKKEIEATGEGFRIIVQDYTSKDE